MKKGFLYLVVKDGPYYFLAGSVVECLEGNKTLGCCVDENGLIQIVAPDEVVEIGEI